MIFDKRKIYNFDPYNVLMAIVKNIPVLLMTGFVVRGNKCEAFSWIKFVLISLRGGA